MGKIIITIEDSKTENGKIDIDATLPNGNTVREVVLAFQQVYGSLLSQLQGYFGVSSNKDVLHLLDVEAGELLVRDVLESIEVDNG